MDKPTIIQNTHTNSNLYEEYDSYNIDENSNSEEQEIINTVSED